MTDFAFFQAAKKKKGLPPGSLVHTGAKKTEKVKITVIKYDKEDYEKKEIAPDVPNSILELAKETLSEENKKVTWINIDGLHRTDILEQMGEQFNLHPLSLEDILNTDQRPKAEDFGNYLYLVTKMFYYDTQRGDFSAEQISIILGPQFVLTFQEHEGDVLDPIRERIKTAKGRIRDMGSDYLAYALMDTIMDSYFPVLEGIGERTTQIEAELMEDPDKRTLSHIYKMKRDLLFFRKSVWPTRDMVSVLLRDKPPLINKATNLYLRDLHDHAIQVIDVLETLREMITGMLDIYLSSVSNRMNSVMKVLTIIATIFIPLTFIAGIYGMNFDNMPELHWEWGYHAVLGLMGIIFIGMLFYFRRKDWI